MNKSLQLSLLLASIIMLLVVLFFVKKNKMNIRYSIIWIVLSIGMIVISIFPGIFIAFKGLIGIEVASNAAFLIIIFVLYCLSFFAYLAISKHNNEIINLNYEIALLKKKVEELNKKE